jgi:hypothetical protein
VRKRYIVLHEIQSQTRLLIALPVPAFKKKAARIPEDFRLNDEQSGNVTASYLHYCAKSASTDATDPSCDP